MSAKRAKLLEVIVTTLEDAIEAERGGADRLELVRDLDSGGLTPDLALVERITCTVQIPVRAMLRENASMSVGGEKEFEKLLESASRLNGLKLDGLVMGFLTGGQIDTRSMKALASAAPRLPITFHRAFDELADPEAAIAELKLLGGVDRILTIGGDGSWMQRKERLRAWQRMAAPEITILAGVGLLQPAVQDFWRDDELREIHVGRAARMPRENDGRVTRAQVAQLKEQGA